MTEDRKHQLDELSITDILSYLGVRVSDMEEHIRRGELKWHNLHKDPTDLPNHTRYVWTNVGPSYYDIEDHCWRDDFGRTNSVIAWCEPKFEVDKLAFREDKQFTRAIFKGGRQMTREWFTTYCQNASANVLDKDGEVRFTYIELRDSLNAASEHRAECVVPAILKLHDNIVNLCDARCGKQMRGDNDEYALLLTLLNIHAAYLMVSGLWKEEAEPKVSGCGFEIF